MVLIPKPIYSSLYILQKYDIGLKKCQIFCAPYIIQLQFESLKIRFLVFWSLSLPKMSERTQGRFFFLLENMVPASLNISDSTKGTDFSRGNEVHSFIDNLNPFF